MGTYREEADIGIVNDHVFTRSPGALGCNVCGRVEGYHQYSVPARDEADDVSTPPAWDSNRVLAMLRDEIQTALDIAYTAGKVKRNTILDALTELAETVDNLDSALSSGEALPDAWTAHQK